jgi:TonB-dependent receptor
MYSQSSTIRGTVLDNSNGEPMIGVTVMIVGSSIGTTTDLDGQFSIETNPGLVSLQFSYISYQTTILDTLFVKDGQVLIIDKIELSEDALETSEVVVTAESIKSNESSIILIKSKSPGMIDGISSDRIKQTGDANVADATKRVTGVSVEGGKYVYVRGLGDRYSKTMLNGLDIPGLDPDRNSLQMDIFPTNLISNIIINKNFTADLPADFTGGLLNIETKDFPEEKVLSFSLGTSYNPNMHLRNGFLRYNGSPTDFLGFDIGTRKLPQGAEGSQIPNPVGYSVQQVRDFNNKFNPTLGGQNSFSFLDLNLGFSYGDQKRLSNNGKLGWIFSLSYKSDYKLFSDVQYGEWQRSSDSKKYEMTPASIQRGSMSERNYLLGGIAGISYKDLYNKIKVNFIHLQNGESRVGRFTIDNNANAVGQSGYGAKSENLEWSQRSLTNLNISGTHNAQNKNFEIDWKLSGNLSMLDEPDIRKTAFSGFDFSENDSTYRFSAGEAGYPSRIWRNLNEINLCSKIDFTKKFILNSESLILKFGTSNFYKVRDYKILTYNLVISSNQNWQSADPNLVYDPNNLYPSPVNTYYIQSANNFPNSNAYISNINNLGFYLSGEYTLFRKLKTIIGLRSEYYVQRHTGRDIAFATGDPNGNNLVNDKVLETFNLFPSLNLIYSINKKMNLRLSLSKTIGRPSFKEISYAQILDPVTNRIFNGSLFSYVNNDGHITWDGQLKETKIDNFDLRWEWFLPNNQLFSISPFFKRFQNPIELVRIPEQQTSSEFQPRNVGEGILFGIELEIRKDFRSIKFLKDFSFYTNITIVKSEITMTDVEFNSRKLYEKQGQLITNKRVMAGQSPVIVNSGLIYQNSKNSFEIGLFYNVKSPTLSIVGTGLSPDVYDEPFHNLNFSFSKKFGKDKNTIFDFKINNLLIDKLESFYLSFNSQKQIFNSLNPGINFSLSVNHKF